MFYFINWIIAAETIEGLKGETIQGRKLFAEIRYTSCSLLSLIAKQNVFFQKSRFLKYFFTKILNAQEPPQNKRTILPMKLWLWKQISTFIH